MSGKDRERRAQAASSRTYEYFVPKDCMDREVITAEICLYLGADALVRLGTYVHPETGESLHGYFITTYTALMTFMTEDLKADSERWEAEPRATALRGQILEDPNGIVRFDFVTHESQIYFGFKEPAPIAQTRNPGASSTATSQHDSNGMNESQEHSYGKPFADYQPSYSHSTRGAAEAPGYLGMGELDSTSHTSSEDMILNFGDGPPIVAQGSDDADGFSSIPVRRLNSRSDMRTTPIKPVLLPSQKLIPRLTPTLRRRIKRTKKDLPILLKSKRFNACADSGATYNMISKALAQDLGCSVFENDETGVFELPIAGQSVESVGRTSIPWHFPDEEDSGNTCEFFVFEQLITPIIMGRAFLRLTNTLDKYKHRLQDRISESLPKIPIIRWSGISQENLPCYLDDTLTDSSPDTGAEVNVISKDFALQITPFIDRTVAGQVQFANGMLHSTLGRIQAKVTFDHAPEFYIQAKFEVIENLRVDVILGDDILFEADVYTQYAHLFRHTEVDTDYSELGTIAWLGIGEKIIHKSTTKTKNFFSRDKKAPAEASVVKELDDRDLQEQDRIEREALRISHLLGAQKRAAEEQEQRAQASYIASRVRFQFGNPDPV